MSFTNPKHKAQQARLGLGKLFWVDKKVQTLFTCTDVNASSCDISAIAELSYKTLQGHDGHIIRQQDSHLFLVDDQRPVLGVPEDHRENPSTGYHDQLYALAAQWVLSLLQGTHQTI